MGLLCGACWVALGLALVMVALKIWHRLASGRCTSKRRMDGKTVIVTGANTGIGKETALELAKRGARVILACRDHKRGTDARDDIVHRSGNKDVYFLPLDLASLSSVRDFVAEVKKREKKLHVLVNNAAAGLLANKRTNDGLQQEMHANHFGPFLLTLLLIDLMKASAPSRVVIVSSGAHKFAKLELDNLNCEKWHSNVYQYANTKLANTLFSNELARRLRGTGVTCNNVHPGVVNTELTRGMPGWLKATYNFFIQFSCKTAEEGAQTSIYLAVAEEVENVTGKYFVDCKESSMSAQAQDEKFAKDLWDRSVQCVKIEPKELNL